MRLLMFGLFFLLTGCAVAKAPFQVAGTAVSVGTKTVGVAVEVATTTASVASNTAHVAASATRTASTANAGKLKVGMKAVKLAAELADDDRDTQDK